MRLQELAIAFASTLLRGDRWLLDPASPHALLLHGGGSSSSAGLAPLREHLREQGIASTAFDFIGHGRTGGSLLGSSLAERLAQVETVLQAIGLTASSGGIIGFSMGGHIAALAAGRHGFAACGLVIPAAYTAAAAALPFGPAFSAAIRQPGSWRDSDAFAAIAGFRGRLQIASAELDAVVPAPIPCQYLQAGKLATMRHHHVIQGAGHDLSAHFAKRPEDRTTLHDRLAALIRQSVDPLDSAVSTPMKYPAA